MKPHLEKLAEIAQDETYITYDELEGWPREQLEEEGYLKEAGRQSVITCDQCSERCPIPRDRVIQCKDDENMGLFPCEHNPDISFVDVNLVRYKQYRIIKGKLRTEGYYQESEDVSKNKGADKYVFRPNGDFWQIVFQGESLPLIKHKKRMLYLYRLLEKPNEEISAFYLVAGVNKFENKTSPEQQESEGNVPIVHNSMSREESLEVIDRETDESYEGALQLLQSDLEKARAIGDKEKEKEKLEHIDFLEKYYKSARGVGNKIRKFNDEQKRATEAVYRGVHRVLNLDIKPYSKELFQHLSNTIKKEGFCCSYKPDHAIDWQV